MVEAAAFFALVCATVCWLTLADERGTGAARTWRHGREPRELLGLLHEPTDPRSAKTKTRRAEVSMVVRGGQG
jgi:hypothetical protein